MCGIAGIIYSDNDKANIRRRILNMQKSLLHRGPDSNGYVMLPSAALAHTRLALLDPEHGQQPMADYRERYYIIYDGEIYNHEDLRKELKCVYPFKTRCDTETLLAAYVTWGEKCLNRIEGMFSFFIWDRLREEGFAARDPMGVKPFVFCFDGNEFIFASETKAILKGWRRRPELNEPALVEYLVMPPFSGVRYSLFKGIKHLGAGEKLTLNKKGIDITKYYTYEIGRRGLTLNDCVDRLRDVLYKSVKRTLKADFPVGSFVSGGIDSSFITYIASKESKRPITSFTIRFQDHDDIEFNRSSIVISDDKPFVEDFASKVDIDLMRVMSNKDELIEALPAISENNDRLAAWEQELTQHFLSQEAKKHIKAVLVGDAADETHYGYFFMLNEKVNYSPKGLMDYFDARTREKCLSVDIQKSFNPVQWLEREYTDLAEKRGYSFSGSNEERVRASTCLITELWLGRLLHNGDIHTMHNSIEARVPFANISVLEAASNVAPLFGFKNGIEKYCLRKAAEPFLPGSIIKRKKSALPCDPRLGRAYQSKLKTFLNKDPDFANRYLNPSEIKRLCGINKLSENERILLFNLISVFYWRRRYLD